MQLAGPMSLSWLANTTEGYMTGDYISTSIVGGQAFPAIAVAFAPQGRTLQEAIYTVALSVAGGLAKARTDGVVVAAQQSTTWKKGSKATLRPRWVIPPSA